MTNLSGYNDIVKISNLEVDSLVGEIMKLSVKEIDMLWYKTGWVDEEAIEDSNKSLPKWRLDKIKKDRSFAEESFVNLVSGDPYHELRTASILIQNLNQIVNNK
jgi:hypothetical protein